ncbi:hypothetical protein CUMW_143910 [Citrus unshiu]|uniref:Uncharacterized protein n=1 Tax=Citrus unshiu TaxID=55188 RepID=A0A2H5PK16_CITUN|nr:hypothetical protein CUMW_143910 [Citrus unshiu]
MAIRSKIFRTLRIAPRHQSTSNRIVTPHQSMPHHRLMPHHRSVYVNSVVNSNVDNTIQVFDRPEFKSDVRFAI